jgi:hypothetical protein
MIISALREGKPRSGCNFLHISRLLVLAALLSLLVISPAYGQISVLTQHYDNARTGANTNETILTHANVNPDQFGKRYTQSIDGFQTAQPLYVPNVFIPALNSTHNVVYVATMHDSVYAFDAENNQGSNASPLWHVNFLDPAHGITTVPVADEKCYVTAYTEFGIQGTPVIDVDRNAIYVLAMTKENGSYVHKVHALNLGTGEELFGGPVTVTASVTIDGQTYPFIDKYQQQRPGLLLQDGTVYIGFGGPGCNIKTEMGWVIAYNADTLQQVGAFNVSPNVMAFQHRRRPFRCRHRGNALWRHRPETQPGKWHSEPGGLFHTVESAIPERSRSRRLFRPDSPPSRAA